MPKQRASDPAVSYNEFKSYEGRRYTGMKIGRSHKWHYDRGEWKEKKITPDLWEISYAVTKRRAGRAPEGSGVPVGTAYHWYILAHQNVVKLNANDYSTSLSGLKFKVAHKRAANGKWSASPAAQRRRMVKFLKQVVEELESETTDTTADIKTDLKTDTTSDKKTKGRKNGKRVNSPPSIQKRGWKRRATRARKS
jgi:hypothetical protein